MKRIAFVLLVACVLVLAGTGMAFANFGPHGMYTQDTDGCAACHRAHTSFSTLGWTESDGTPHATALLISNAANMTDFCYACHGNGAPGASTNVQAGIYDSGPTGGRVGSSPALTDPNRLTPVFYPSHSSYDSTLNGGGFETIGNSASPVMSAHDMKGGKVGSPIPWGFATDAGVADLTPLTSFKCTSCHDPHGSSNYRLLKDNVNGVKKGGYNVDGSPDAWVISNEDGFPSGGFKKGADGLADNALYKPNYTSPQYAKNDGKAMSSWCAGCHTAYDQSDSAYDYGATLQVYDDAGVGTNLGAQTFHRHQVDISLAAGFGHLNVDPLDDPGLPLEMGVGQFAAGADYDSAKPWDTSGNISCLTCHRAHGSEATMEGWAVADLGGAVASPAPRRITVGNTAAPATHANPLGVGPNYSQAILRFDNRGVCERCHNK